MLYCNSLFQSYCPWISTSRVSWIHYDCGHCLVNFIIYDK